MKISATIIARDEEENIERCFNSLRDCVDEIILVDSGSQDATMDISRAHGATILKRDWTGYVEQKNFAIDHASHNWVLSIDADEELSCELRKSIEKIKLIDDKEHPAGYLFSRVVFYRGKWIRHGDWYPDRLVRLFDKSKAHFTGGKVHERLKLDGDAELLAGELHHYTYKNAKDRAERLTYYAKLWAETKAAEGKRSNYFKGGLHAVVCFIKGYVLRFGFLDGIIGWEISYGNAKGTWLKYKLLAKR